VAICVSGLTGNPYYITGTKSKTEKEQRDEIKKCELTKFEI